MPGPSTTYTERLYVPLRWWVQATMLLATVWLAFVVATPGWVAWSITITLAALTYGMFCWWGSARLLVQGDQLYAGPARIALDLLGDAQVLDAEGTRRVLGVQADARAYLVTRPYLRRAVRLPIEDPADPVPYWLLGTRRPVDLARALADAGRSRSERLGTGSD